MAYHKIVAQAAEEIAIKRSVPKVNISQIDFLGGLDDHFLACGNLRPAQISRAVVDLRKEFGLNEKKNAISRAVANPSFSQALKEDPNKMAAAIHFAKQLIAQKRSHDAREFITGLLERGCGKDKPLLLGLRLLRASANERPEQLVEEYLDVARRNADDPLLWQTCHYHAAFVLYVSGKKKRLPEILRQLPGPAHHQGGVPLFTPIVAAIFNDDLQAAQAAFEKIIKSAKVILDISNDIYETLKAYLELRAGKTYAGEARLFAPTSKAAFDLTMGERYLAEGKPAEAETCFMKHTDELGSITRLNEMRVGKKPAHEGEARVVISQLDREIRIRRERLNVGTREDLVVLYLQKRAYALQNGQPQAVREAATGLIEATKGTELETLTLYYAAANPAVTSVELRGRAFFRVVSPGTVIPVTEIGKHLASQLFGPFAADEDVLMEEVREARRSIAARSEKAPAEVMIPEGSQMLVAALFPAFAAEEMAMRREVRELLGSDQRLFFGSVISPFKVTDHCGIVSFDFRLEAKARQVFVAVRLRDGYCFERPFNADFQAEMTKDADYNRLLTLIIFDFFLALQKGGTRRGIYETVDFQHFTESEYLQELRLSSRISRLVRRPPTKTEEEVDDLADELKKKKKKPVKGIGSGRDSEAAAAQREKQLEQKRAIFLFSVFPRVLAGQPIQLNIPKEASLSPLADLLESMDIHPEGKGAAIKLHNGSGRTIEIRINEDGNIVLTDSNRGTANLELIRELNELIIDVMAIHFHPHYRSAIAGEAKERIFEQMFLAAQNTEEARRRKLLIWQMLLPVERNFRIVQEDESRNPFEVTFFSVIDEEGHRSTLIPKRGLDFSAAEALVKEGNKLAQVVVVGLHLSLQPDEISPERIRFYVQRMVLGWHKPTGQLSASENDKISEIISRIARGETELDPNSLLHPDREHPSGVSFAKEIEFTLDGATTRRKVQYNWVRPHLKVYEAKTLPPAEAILPPPPVVVRPIPGVASVAMTARPMEKMKSPTSAPATAEIRRCLSELKKGGLTYQEIESRTGIEAGHLAAINDFQEQGTWEEMKKLQELRAQLLMS